LAPQAPQVPLLQRAPGAVQVPPLPASEIMLLSTLSDAQSRDALRTLAMAFREHRPSPAANGAKPRFRNSQMVDSPV